MVLNENANWKCAIKCFMVQYSVYIVASMSIGAYSKLETKDIIIVIGTEDELKTIGSFIVVRQ